VYDFSIILPTLNESQSIRTTITQIWTYLFDLHLNAEIIVVDDNSTDGTIDIVKDISAIHDNVSLFVRQKDPGLSQSVMVGFSQAKSNILIVTDADGQHPVEVIPVLYHVIKYGTDIVIGSRYMPGGGIEDGWGNNRRAISNGATMIAKLTFPEITDPVSGFFAINRSVLTPDINPSGYKILTEILGKGRYETVTEIPYIFKVRNKGVSKLRFKTIIEFCRQMFGIFKYTILHKTSPARKEIEMVLTFMVVGASGILVNTSALWLLVSSGIALSIAGTIATESAILTNFIFNELWTFKQLKRNEDSTINRFVMFNIVSLLGLFISVGIMLILAYFGMHYLVANLIGIFVAFIWNYLLNRSITWGK